jgi:hypothetical protein
MCSQNTQILNFMKISPAFHADRRTDMKLIVALPSSANAPKIRWVILGPVSQSHAFTVLLLLICSNWRSTALGEYTNDITCLHSLMNTNPVLQKLK